MEKYDDDFFQIMSFYDSCLQNPSLKICILLPYDTVTYPEIVQQESNSTS